MNLEILKDAQNPLFNRKEVFAKVTAPSAPSKKEVGEALATKYKVDANALRVIDVQGKFGVQEFTVRANVYPSNEERDKVEQLTKKEKEAEKVVEAPQEEAPAEAPATPEPVPTEEPKEDKAEEVKEEKKTE